MKAAIQHNSFLIDFYNNTGSPYVLTGTLLLIKKYLKAKLQYSFCATIIYNLLRFFLNLQHTL